jgi:NADH-ubiquinone oxidoreductase chain 5
MICFSIISLPFLAFLASGLFGRKLGKSGVQIITSGSVSLAAILSVVAFYNIALKGSFFGENEVNSVSIILMPWIGSEILTVNWGFQFDSVSITMCVIILSISSLVHIYSIGYMSEDPHIQRFFSYLSLFTFFMLILVCSDNFLLMFVGWEGVGLASYLLINFWFTRVQANKSAMQAILMNRVGDWGLSIALFSLIWFFGAIDYSTINACGIPNMAPSSFIVTFITLFLLLAAVGKSAQLGLHTWLPSAMEGPTPVSALIHAATMVTAGVYLILRSSPLFELAPTSLICVCIVGSLTSIFAATTGLFQNDLKRVIAYSTMSQLGLTLCSNNSTDDSNPLKEIDNSPSNSFSDNSLGLPDSDPNDKDNLPNKDEVPHVFNLVTIFPGLNDMTRELGFKASIEEKLKMGLFLTLNIKVLMLVGMLVIYLKMNLSNICISVFYPPFPHLF